MVGELAASGLWLFRRRSPLDRGFRDRRVVEIALAQSGGSECVHVVYGLEGVFCVGWDEEVAVYGVLVDAALGLPA